MELKKELESMLANFEPGQKIPSERELSRKFGMARMTIRNSIEPLILEGKLERRPGSGTYLTGQCYSLTAQCRSFSNEMHSLGLVPRNELLFKKIVSADKIVANKLRIPGNSKVLKFTRIRYGGEQIMAVQSTSIPLAYIGKVSDGELEGALEDLLLHKFEICITTSQTEIGGEFPDLKIANWLGVPHKTPCLIKETIDVDQNSRTVMWNKTWYNAEKFKIRFETACGVRDQRTLKVS